MAYSYVVTIASGSTPNVAVPFSYLDEAHVHVALNGVQVDDATLTWLSAGQIQLASTPGSGVSVKVWRNTPVDDLEVVFQNPAMLEGEDLNRALQQMLYVVQEAFDIGATTADDLTSITDYVNNAMAAAAESAANAATSEANAAGHENDAAAQAAAAAASALLSSEWATKTSATVDGTDFSAKFWALQAQAVAASMGNPWTPKGGWDPTTGTFPGSGLAQLGWLYIAVDSHTFAGLDLGGGDLIVSEGDVIVAQVNNAADDTFVGNWVKLQGPLTAAEVEQALGYTPANNATVLSPFVGVVAYFPASAAPAGWAKANGQTVSRAGPYANLWAFAQSSGNLAAVEGSKTQGQFGPGDGSTTFSLPNLNGEFIRSWDDGAGVDSGRALGSEQADALQDHRHGMRHSDKSGSVAGSDVARFANAGNVLTGAETNSVSSTGVSGGAPRLAAETRPRNVALLACIKL